ncbi:MAG: NAD(P)H-binding protein [Myxococcaceae bacterium]|nr:NAD(P)H-binding protein [Myxococcaceae bacterium]
MRVLVAGGTGYIGRHVVRELVLRGHDVSCVVRREAAVTEPLAGADVRCGEVTDLASVRAAVASQRFDAVVSCLATRTGAPADAWRVEHQANLNVLEVARSAGVQHFVLLSAICVQRPRLAFQHAKLAFERALMASGVAYSIVRPTAFFKSLAGQVPAVKRGKPFMVFGDGELTACKPISERDLARFLADCLEHPAKHNQVLPIGGPGPPVSPRQQAALLSELRGAPVPVRRVPVWLLGFIAALLGGLGRWFPGLAEKAELVRIGRYYATESMLAFDAAHGRYDAEATPSYGHDTLRDFYARVWSEGLSGQELGDHALFTKGNDT